MAEVKVKLNPASTAEDVIFDFEIPGGEKGDPGGIVNAAALSNLNDLDDVKTPGTYYWSNQSMPLNAPNAYANNMIVIGLPPSGLTQIVYARSSAAKSGVFWMRSIVNNAWESTWRIVASTRTDQTAGRAIYQWDELNNREQLVYGDTGLRDISSLLINSWSMATGLLTIRRTGNVVELRGSLNGSVMTNDHFVDLGAFMSSVIPANNQSLGVCIASDYSMFREIRTDGTQLYIRSGTKVPYGVNAMWTTNASWPTSLPGTAVGSIPNL